MTGREGGSPDGLISIVTEVTRPQPRGRHAARAIPQALLDFIPFYFISFFTNFPALTGPFAKLTAVGVQWAHQSKLTAISRELVDRCRKV